MVPDSSETPDLLSSCIPMGARCSLWFASSCLTFHVQERYGREYKLFGKENDRMNLWWHGKRINACSWHCSDLFCWKNKAKQHGIYVQYSKIGGRDLHQQNIFKYSMLTLLKARSAAAQPECREAILPWAASLPLLLTILHRVESRGGGGVIEWDTLALFLHMHIPVAAEGSRVQTAQWPLVRANTNLQTISVCN